MGHSNDSLEVTLYYDQIDNIQSIVELLDYFNINRMSIDENSTSVEIDTLKIDKSTLYEYGFFIGSKYIVSVSADRYECNSLTIRPTSVSSTMQNETISFILRTDPLYGFVSSQSEHHACNRISQEFPEGDVSAWVGRDIRSYVPGVYTGNFLSSRYASKHSVDLEDWSYKSEHISEANESIYIERPKGFLLGERSSYPKGNFFVILDAVTAANAARNLVEFRSVRRAFP